MFNDDTSEELRQQAAHGVFLLQGIMVTELLCEIFVLNTDRHQLASHRLTRSLQLGNLALHNITTRLHYHGYITVEVNSVVSLTVHRKLMTTETVISTAPHSTAFCILPFISPSNGEVQTNCYSQEIQSACSLQDRVTNNSISFSAPAWLCLRFRQQNNSNNVVRANMLKAFVNLI